MHAQDAFRRLEVQSVSQTTAEQLCSDVPVVSPATTNAAVRDIFDVHRDLLSLPVVDVTVPVGLIKRHTFLSEMAKPFRKELYDRKSCTNFTDMSALVVDAQTPIADTAERVISSNNNALADGFIVIKDGNYFGVAFGLDLMRVVTEMQAEKHRQMMLSIDYASVIQRAMLSASSGALSSTLSDAKLLWQPRDIIGGDFYHFAAFDGGWFVAIGDCTGHGVPGAFMTLISSSWLSQSLERHGPRDPAQLLSDLNRNVKQSLGQDGGVGSESDDGLDALLAFYDIATSQLTYASARMPMFLLGATDDAVVTLSAARTGVGYRDTSMEYAWTNHVVDVPSGSILCVTTDGFTDQIGGPRRISFGKARLRKLLEENRRDSMSNLAKRLSAALVDYESGQRRRDDVTVFCARIP